MKRKRQDSEERTNKQFKFSEEPNRHIFGKKLKRKYGNGLATDTVYSVSIIDPAWLNQPFIDVQSEMTSMWEDVLRMVQNQGVLPTDLIRIHLSHIDLPKGDIKIPLQKFGNLTAQAIMDRIAMVLQSYASLKVDDDLEISIGVIKFPRGEGRVCITNVNTDLKRKTSLTVINNDDGLCLVRSLVVCRAFEKRNRGELTRKQWLLMIEKNSVKQKREAEELLAEVGLRAEESSSMSSIPIFEKHMNVDIVVLSSDHENKVIYPKNLSHDLQHYVYYIPGQPGHFHSVKAPQSLMGVGYFCKKCLQGYKTKNVHRCQGVCQKCKSTECSKEGHPMSCIKCAVEFCNEECYWQHLRRGKAKSVCESFWQCRKCRRYYAKSKTDSENHLCHHYWCKVCERQVPNSHRCYQRFLNEKKPRRIMIFFDFECTQESGEHIPNLVVARRYDVIANVYTEHFWRGDDVRDSFGSWLFHAGNKGAVVVAHNMKGYDGVFLMHYMLKHGVVHNVIYNGTKIMQITVCSSLDMRIIDSLNFFPMPLSRLPKTFGLQNVKKGDFPHLFNKKENYGYKGPYPSLEHYAVNNRSTQDRQALIEWHETIKNRVFDFELELLDYCRNDVRILSESCLKFRGDFMQVTEGLDPFLYMTIASATMNVFKRNFLKEELQVVSLEEAEDAFREKRPPTHKTVSMTFQEASRRKDIKSKSFISSDVALTPHNGYMNRDNFSYASIAWLHWQELLRGVTIRHALSLEGEFHVPNTDYRVDGYCESDNTVYEFYGCLFHGCRKCRIDSSAKVPKTGETAEALYYKTLMREKKIKSLGFNLVTVWEHDFARQLRENDVLNTFVQNLDLQPNINLREAFYGGRTNACRLYHDAQDDEVIRYLDFTSLYPYTNKYCKYPVGHPEIIVKDFQDLSSYFGIAKVRILPPKTLYHPVLPLVSKGKLKFPLCATCAENETQGPCKCSDRDRSFVGTWCTPELMMAVKKGYQIVKIYQVFHWRNTSQYDPKRKDGGLFTDFINKFLKIKQESSGWPEWCGEDPGKRQDYLNSYAENEGILLDPENIEYNPGRRALSKLILNGFWGKYGQRSDLKKTKYVRSRAEFLSHLLDDKNHLDDFHIVNENLVILSYTPNSEFVEECSSSNVVIAAFTTCWARLRLYNVLDRLQDNCLYFDTDSVIFVQKKGEAPPLETGDYLGDLTDELKQGNHITTFVSGGPKNYAYRENDGSLTCKVRGFTLNHTNKEYVNFETMKNMVLQQSAAKITLPARNKICRDKYQCKVYNRKEDRKYGLVYTKRRIVENFNTLPYGHV